MEWGGQAKPAWGCPALCLWPSSSLVYSFFATALGLLLPIFVIFPRSHSFLPPPPSQSSSPSRHHEAYIQGTTPSHPSSGFFAVLSSTTLIITFCWPQDLKQEKFVIEVEPSETVCIVAGKHHALPPGAGLIMFVGSTSQGENFPGEKWLRSRANESDLLWYVLRTCGWGATHS